MLNTINPSHMRRITYEDYKLLKNLPDNIPCEQ